MANFHVTVRSRVTSTVVLCNFIPSLSWSTSPLCPTTTAISLHFFTQLSLSLKLLSVGITCDSVVGCRVEGPSGFSWPRGVPSLLLLVFFLFWRCGGGVEGDGCSWWSIGGDDGELLVAARKTVPTVAVLDIRQSK